MMKRLLWWVMGWIVCLSVWTHGARVAYGQPIVPTTAWSRYFLQATNGTDAQLRLNNAAATTLVLSTNLVVNGLLNTIYGPESIHALGNISSGGTIVGNQFQTLGGQTILDGLGNITTIGQVSAATEVITGGSTVGGGAGGTNYINGSLLSRPNNLNMDQLYKFYAALNLGTRPVRILSISDLGDWPGGTAFKYSMRGLLGNIGALSGGGGGEGDVALATSGVSQTIDATTWGLGSGLYYATNGSTVTWSRRNVNYASPGTKETNFFVTKAVVWYLAETNGGTFKVQTNINGGGWNDMQTINCAAIGTNSVATNFTLTAGYYSIRVLGVSGTCRIIDGGLWNDTKNGVLNGTGAFTITSRAIVDINNCPTNCTWPVFASFNPDLILVMDTDQARTPTAWAQFAQMVTNNCTNADVVVCGNHFVGYNVDPTNAWQFNVEAVTNCLKYGWGYFDTWGYLGTNIVDQTNHGILLTDQVHFSPAGIDYLNGKLFQAVVRGLATANYAHTDPNFQGAEVGLLNSTRADVLGIGTITPDKNVRVDIQTDPQTHVKWVGGNQAFMEFAQGNFSLDTSRTTNITRMVDQNGDLWLSPVWPQGGGALGNLYFGQPFPGKGLGTWFPSGGLVLGPASGPSDPGPYTLQATNVIVGSLAMKYGWLQLSNGVIAVPAFNRSDTSLSTGIYFYDTNGAYCGNFDAWGDHAGAGHPEVRMISQNTIALVPGQSTYFDGYGEEGSLQFGVTGYASEFFLQNETGSTNDPADGLSLPHSERLAFRAYSAVGSNQRATPGIVGFCDTNNPINPAGYSSTMGILDFFTVLPEKYGITPGNPGYTNTPGIRIFRMGTNGVSVNGNLVQSNGVVTLNGAVTVGSGISGDGSLLTNRVAAYLFRPTGYAAVASTALTNFAGSIFEGGMTGNALNGQITNALAGNYKVTVNLSVNGTINNGVGITVFTNGVATYARGGGYVTTFGTMMTGLLNLPANTQITVVQNSTITVDPGTTIYVEQIR